LEGGGKNLSTTPQKKKTAKHKQGRFSNGDDHSWKNRSLGEERKKKKVNLKTVLGEQGNSLKRNCANEDLKRWGKKRKTIPTWKKKRAMENRHSANNQSSIKQAHRRRPCKGGKPANHVKRDSNVGGLQKNDFKKEKSVAGRTDTPPERKNRTRNTLSENQKLR